MKSEEQSRRGRATARKSFRQCLRECLPLATAASYFVLGLFWIWSSDAIASVIFTDTDALSGFQSVKGTAFVAVTALFLYTWLAFIRRDVARLPEVEHRLQEAEQQFRSLFELAPDGIVVHDRDEILFANAAFCSALGLGGDGTLSQMRLRDLVDPADRDMLGARIDRLAQNIGITDPVEISVRALDGRVIEAEHVSCSVRVGGRIVVQSHLRDITARNEARRELQRVNGELEARIAARTAELQAANQALESFTYSVAHDLRAPVAHVDGFAAALKRTIEQRDPAKAAHYTERIIANARLMGEMIEGLLALSRSGRATLQHARVDNEALVRNVVDELDEPSRGAVHVAGLPAAVADPATLRQVWSNLVSNAVKYSARSQVPRVVVGGRDEGDQCVFWVEDNGVGFDDAESGRLFQVFQRLASAHDFAGTGVGLAIVKRIVERHGGRVWARGRPGQGATFYFTLPASAA